MPSFSDSIFLFVLALLLFGPKKLPVLARELGKWVGEFRRASNEFKMQMEEELRQVEQADRQKQIAAMEAAAPVAAPVEEPEHPHLPASTDEGPNTGYAKGFEADPNALPEVRSEGAVEGSAASAAEGGTQAASLGASQAASQATSEATAGPLPIATSGELKMMPPSTGLPTARGTGDPLGGGLLESIPKTEDERQAEDRAGEMTAEMAAEGNGRGR